MQVKVKILKVYQDGILDEVIIIGDEDELSKNICIKYKGLTESDVEGLNHRLEYYTERFIKSVKVNGEYLWEGENYYAPAEWGTTKVTMTIETIEVQ